MDARCGDWVTVYNIVLEPEDRAPNVPEDTKKVPLEMWVKGFIKDDGNIGDLVEVNTITGRLVSGKLLNINPYYEHNYGQCIPELFQIGLQAREILFGGEASE